MDLLVTKLTVQESSTLLRKKTSLKEGGLKEAGNTNPGKQQRKTRPRSVFQGMKESRKSKVFFSIFCGKFPGDFVDFE